MTGWLLLACVVGIVLGAGGMRLATRQSGRPATLSVPAIRKDVTTGPLMSLEDMLEFLPGATLILDIDGVLRFSNAEALAAFGDLLGTIVRHPEIFSALNRLDAEITEATVDLALDVPVRRVVRAGMRRIPGDPVRISVSLVDRSEQDAVERVRADFVAYASHELRTPLAALIGFIDTLRGPAANDLDAQKQFLGIMAGQAARMQRLIDQLLALSRVEMMEHRRPRGTVNAEYVVARVRDESAPLLHARNMTLETRPKAFVCPGDEDQIVQVLLNLIENAAKYTSSITGRAPQVSLSVRMASLGSRPGVAFDVTDNGPGIEAQHLPRLTERFYRVEGREGEAPGYGLGLAIVRHIVDRHEGRFSVESEPGVGTCCTVWLPAQSDRKVSRERPSLLLS